MPGECKDVLDVTEGLIQFKAVERYSLNTAGHDWVVGDIHGCFSILEQLLDEIQFDSTRDRLFSVGDLIDRGPESPRAPEYVRQPWFHAVRGNHEQFLLEAQGGDWWAESLWQANGGDWYFQQPESVRWDCASELTRLPYVIEVETRLGTVGVVHADVPRRMSWRQFVRKIENGDSKVLETAVWGRLRATGKIEGGVKEVARVFCGHTPIGSEIRRVGNVYFIDTGAVYGLEYGVAQSGLTIMELTEDAVHIWPTMPEQRFQL